MQIKNKIPLKRKTLYGIIMLLGIFFSVFSTENLPSVQAQDEVTSTPTNQGQVTPTPEVEAQIVGGAPADPGEYPWQVALVDGSATNLYNGQFCGGSLIHPEWVLTAAHCITEDNGTVSLLSSVDVVAGIYDLLTPVPGYQRRDVIQIIRHPSYNNNTIDNDIALLKLASPVVIGGAGATRTAVIPPVLASAGDLTGASSQVTGWGRIIYSPATWDTELYEVQLPVISNSTCNDASHWGGDITNNMLCAGIDAGTQSACNGDSGGPLVVLNSGTGQWNLAGIVSFGPIGCSVPYLPSVFTRVSQYGSWVSSYLPPIALTVIKTGSGSGTVTSSPAGITCGVDCSESYAYTTVVTLTATPASGSMFTGWSGGGCSGSNTCTVVMTDIKSVTATFTLKSYTNISQWTSEFNNQSWKVGEHPRLLGDVNGDGKDDVVGFGIDGVWVGLSTGSGFGAMSRWTTNFNYQQGWRVAQHPRLLGDVNGDGKADLIGFGYTGVWVALSTGSGFGSMSMWTSEFNYSIQGWRIEQHPRMVGDVNGDGKDDLIGFGNNGVWVTLSTGSGFGTIRMWTSDFNYLIQGWRVEQHPRMVGDVNGDGKDDLIGFGYTGVWVGLSNGTSIAPISMWTSDFNYSNQSWRVEQHPRLVGDVSGEGRADLVGYGYYGVWMGLSNGTNIAPISMVTDDYNYMLQGWRVEQHPRLLGDVSGDGKDDLVGFGDYGVWVAVAK